MFCLLEVALSTSNLVNRVIDAIGEALPLANSVRFFHSDGWIQSYLEIGQGINKCLQN